MTLKMTSSFKRTHDQEQRVPKLKTPSAHSLGRSLILKVFIGECNDVLVSHAWCLCLQDGYRCGGGKLIFTVLCSVTMLF